MLLNGEGRQLTATTTATVTTFDKSGANSVSVDVEGSEAVYALVNITKTDFDTAYAANKTIKIRSGLPYTFNAELEQNISSICIRTASSTSAVNLAIF